VKKIGFVLVVLVLTVLSVGAVLANGPDWDRSSLEFTGACWGDCDQIAAEICNHGDGDMEGSVAYEVWYAPSGNPKFGKQVGGGTVPALASGECATITHNPAESGNYMFKAYQRAGHPGTGELWSEQCSVECPPPVCEEVDRHYGEWGPWSEWSECTNGKKSRSRSREVWETDANDPSVECDRWPETETQTIDCDLCVDVDRHYGEWSDWSEWSACINSEQTRTRTREVWETDANDPSVECDRWPETETETRDCEVPEAGCNEACTTTADCETGLDCIDDVCVDKDCPGDPDCVCEVPPSGCNEPPTEAGCKDGFVLHYGLCRNPECLDDPTCSCKPCPNAEVIKRITRCGVPVEGVCVRLFSSWGDEIPSPGEHICTDATGIAYFGRSLGVTQGNKTWVVEVSGEVVDSFTVPECEMSISLTNELPCPPTPTPPLDVDKLPDTGIPPAGVNPVLLLLGGISTAIGGFTLLRRR